MTSPRAGTAASLTPLEIAGHVAVGPGVPLPPAPSPERPGGTGAVRRALEAALRAPLEHPPCLVSFSGGHDSSLLLGLAARVARREGLDPPVPITWRFTGAPRAEESEIQEAVVRSLAVADWLRLDAHDDLDLVGPVAQGVLRRHGLLYPANAFLHAPLFERAAGGSLVTGFGGDHVLTRLRRSRRPWWAAPPGQPPFPWLRAGAARRLRRSLARERHAVPRPVVERGAWRATRRDVVVACASLAAIAEAAGARVAHPLLDPAVLAAMAASGVTPHQAGGRAPMVRALFGEVLPEPCLTGRPKAVFREVFWRRHTRDLLEGYAAEAIDEPAVDRDGLRTEWRQPRPSSRTALLVQKAWLVMSGADGDPEPPGANGETDRRRPGR